MNHSSGSAIGASEQRWVSAAVRVCLIIAMFVAVAAFLLSFSALHSLALRSGVPERLAWLWPLVVDVTIVQSTVALVALAHVGAGARERAYFWTLGIGAVGVSLAGNAADMALPAGQSVTGLWAAAVAVVAPVSLLASTHAVLLLVRCGRRGAQIGVREVASVEAVVSTDAADSVEGAGDGGLVDGEAGAERSAVREAGPSSRSVSGPVEMVAEDVDEDVAEQQLAIAVDEAISQAQMPGLDEVCGVLAAGMRSALTVDDVREILLEQTTPERCSNRALAGRFDVDPSTIGRILARAEKLGWKAADADSTVTM